jgi:hypothetical protein
MYRNLRALSILTNFLNFPYIRVHLTADRNLKRFLVIHFLFCVPWNPFAYHRWYAYYTLGNTGLNLVRTPYSWPAFLWCTAGCPGETWNSTFRWPGLPPSESSWSSSHYSRCYNLWLKNIAWGYLPLKQKIMAFLGKYQIRSEIVIKDIIERIRHFDY